MSGKTMNMDALYKTPCVLIKGTRGYFRAEDKLSWIIALYYFDRRCISKKLIQRKRVCTVDNIELLYYPLLLKCYNNSCIIIDPLGEEDIVRDYGVMADLVILFNKALKTRLPIEHSMLTRINKYLEKYGVSETETDYTIPKISPGGIYLVPLFNVRYSNGDNVIHPPIFLSEATIFVRGYIDSFHNLDKLVSTTISKPNVVVCREEFLDTGEPIQVTAMKEEINELSNLLGILEDELKKRLSPYL